MSDEIDQDLLKELGETGSDGELPDLGSVDIETKLGDGGMVVETPSVRSRARPRLVGLLALLLGVIGSVIMVFTAALVIRLGFTASDTVDRLMEPVEVSFDRMEARIDETDDLVDREGIVDDRVDELQARVDGLVDVSTGAHQVFETIEDHPVYGFLPAELSTLGEALADFETAANTIDDRLGTATNGDRIEGPAAAAVADQLDGMQSRVSEVRELISSAASSLRWWIRFGALLGFLGSLWGLWGQISLARRGWRGFRGR